MARASSSRKTTPQTLQSDEPCPDRAGAMALRLADLARGSSGLVHVATAEPRIEGLARLLWAMCPDVETFLFPPWDCLPYDRTSPSGRLMGLRIATMTALASRREKPWIVLATPEGLWQRLPPPKVWAGRTVAITVGDTIAFDRLRADLIGIGYREDDRVDEVGEFALRGHVVDVFPAGYYLPVRIEHQDGRVASISSYEAATQRRTDSFDTVSLRPVSEAVLPADSGEAGERTPGLEHMLPDLYGELSTLFDYAPGALLTFEPETDDRARSFRDQVRDACETRSALSHGGRPSSDRLHLTEGQYQGRVAEHPVLRFQAGMRSDAVPDFSSAEKPAAALADFVASARADGQRVVLAASTDSDLRPFLRVLQADANAVESWTDVLAAPAGSLLRFPLDLDRGFVAAADGAVVLTPADLLGRRAGASASARVETGVFEEESFRIGDTVIHLDHGVGVLEGLEAVADGTGGHADTIRLTFAADAKLMVPVSDVELMWRYGAASDKVALDRLDGSSWPKRRAKVEAEIDQAAESLAQLAAERRAVPAPKIGPPRRDYDRFVARFPFSETPDQGAAVDDILADLASGHAMDRLVCGDVGFGKTEVALRAAAAAAFAGRQVAVVAPTTVLVRQHLETFRRRFAELGIEVGHLSRLVSPADAKAVKAGLADGRVRVVIGTHALAAKSVAFHDLGLLIIDEEQRFGAAEKAKLRAQDEAVHVLNLSATPIPRTMQSALVGLQAVSVLATPPADRQPVRTVLSEFDEATVRNALLREHRRGGQSFVVCPQIEDIEQMAERLRALVPELETLVAHGKLPAAAIDETMVRFADGHGDVLLATNIIESGLDVPRANTIVVWRADRFGLAQLHQLRGRVGRGRLRGSAYLLTEPGATIADATRKRLSTLERLDRLGAGFAISGEDLDQRGAGDLLGENQAGHMKLIGAGLYRRLLERALVKARGETPAEEWNPDLHLGLSGLIPTDYVPEEEVRLNLYARIAHDSGSDDGTALRDEIEDRFGDPPPEVLNLLALTRAKRLCREADVARVDAGPQAIAFTFKTRRESDPTIVRVATESGGEMTWKGSRLIVARAIADPVARLEAVDEILASLRSCGDDATFRRTTRARSRKPEPEPA